MTKEYDNFMNKTLVNLYSLGKRNNNILILKDFNPDNIEHLYLLEVSKVTRTFFNYQIILNMPFYKKIKKKILWKEKTKRKVPNGIDINDFLTFTKNGEKIDIKDIYKAFYEKN